MKIFTAILWITTIFISCKNKDSKQVLNKAEIVKNDSLTNIVFNKDWKALTKDFTTWYNYSYYNVILSEDFIGLDVDSQKISKQTFLNNLINKTVVAFKTKIVDGKSVYQLFAINSKDESIITISKQNAALELAHLNMEGKELPEYNFKDLNGNIYNKKNTKGKILVLKCWFIGCTACVAEFPTLNKIVDENKNNKKIVFVSLAFDDETALYNFFKIKDFKYATVPNMKDFVINKLNITQFPTHILIDENGKIKKLVNKIEEFIPFLEMGKK